ncbi:F-box/FBD/LRR-repeat protein At1g13570-like [Rutidosis leptorrhynchoides]|uniref:F-box/FBD/LRR-repeat protein At1g13570-like n=1 Tax=Rutidosis leptorrhynchoides TaxID=125765 RepID=UPI003A9A130B
MNLCFKMNAQRLLLDGTITTLPSDIIENIMWRLPIEEVVRTSILSKEWRYNWTKIPKVVFTEEMFDESMDENQLPVIEQGLEEPKSERKKMSRRCKLFYAINKFLLLHHRPIVDFTISMSSSDSNVDSVEIDQILLHLSRKNTVKKIHLSFGCGSFNQQNRTSFLEGQDDGLLLFYKLPLCIFSFHHLYLSGCAIFKPQTLNRFGSLTTLLLENVVINDKALVHILSNNPLLKNLTMLKGANGFVYCKKDDHATTLVELFQFLPVIEHLVLCVRGIQVNL